MRQYKIAYRQRDSRGGFTLKADSQANPAMARAELMQLARAYPTYEYILVEVLAETAVDVKVVDL